MQIARGARGAAACCSTRQQRVPPVQVTGWCAKPTADQAGLLPSCSHASTSNSHTTWQQQQPRRVLIAAAATAEAGGEAAADAEIGIHEVEELRGIRASLDSEDPVVEYRVHWKDGSADTWCAEGAQGHVEHGVHPSASLYCSAHDIQAWPGHLWLSSNQVRFIHGCGALPCSMVAHCVLPSALCRELASNLSPDLIRDFDERWWQAAKKVRVCVVQET